MKKHVSRRSFLKSAGLASSIYFFPARTPAPSVKARAAEDEDVHTFVVGDMKCTCIKDWQVGYPLENFFKNVPTETLQGVLKSRGLPTDNISTPLTHLVVDTGKNKILVDTGLGKNLVPLMRKSGIDPASIDTVLITHAHPDHIGGILNEQGAINFVNARYYMAGEEWDFWFSEHAAKITFERHIEPARKALTPIKGRTTFLNGATSILPGITAIPAPGHTPGHTVYSFREKLFYTGDTVLNPLHLEHPDWLPIYDILPEKAEASKKEVFNLLAQKEALVVAQQFIPFPSLGHVVKKDIGWNWVPVQRP